MYSHKIVECLQEHEMFSKACEQKHCEAERQGISPDNILDDGTGVDYDIHDRLESSYIYSILRNAQKFYIGQVEALPIKDDGIVAAGQEMVGAKLPYDKMLLTYEMGSIVDNEKRILKPTHYSRCATLVYSMDYDENIFVTINFFYNKKTKKWDSHYIFYLISTVVDWREYTDFEKLKNQFVSKCFNKNLFEKLKFTEYPMHIFPITGAIANARIRNGEYSPLDYRGAVDEFMQRESWSISATAAILKLFTCKNIITKNVSAPSKLNKKRKKSGKHPLYEYKTLHIMLPGKSQKTTPIDCENGHCQRLHLCRGHFKEYTKDKPLFGRLVGRYWWQPHARGDKAYGEIKKDYVVTPRKNNP